MFYPYKEVRVVENYKTGNKRIEYRIFNEEDVYKTCSPSAWKALKLDDRTTKEHKLECNIFLLRSKFKDNFNKMLEFNKSVYEKGKEEGCREIAIKYSITLL